MLTIYVPNATPSPDLLPRLGLDDLTLPGEQGSATQILDHGPDGGGGLLIEFGRPSGNWQAFQWEPCWPDAIRKLPAARFYWGSIASYTPAGLAKPNMCKGPLRDFADGRQWQLPNMLMLPHRFTLDPTTGEEIREVHPGSKLLYDRLAWAFDVCKNAIEGHAALPEKECRTFLAECLSINYRVNRELVYRLRLLDEETWFSHLAYVTDVDRLMQIQDDVQKKMAASITPG